MALTTAQRNALPRSAFGYAPAGAPRSKWKYPMPTKAQARKAHIPEGQRQRTLRNAVSRGAQHQTAGSRGKVESVARRRAGAPKRQAGSPRNKSWGQASKSAKRGGRSAGHTRRTRRS